MHKILGGLEKRSSLDSVQQALFFSHLTGKAPGVVIFDTDGAEGPYEYRIRIVAELAGVRYENYNWMDGLKEEPIQDPEIPNLPDFGSWLDFGW